MPRQAAKKHMMVLMQKGYSRPRSRQSCRDPNKSIQRLPLVPTVPHTRGGSLARWEAWVHRQDAPAHPSVAGSQMLPGARRAKLLASERAARPLWCAGQYHPSQSYPCGAGLGKAARTDGKKIRIKAQHLNGTGKMGPVGCSWSPLFMRPGYSPTSKLRWPPV